MFFTWTFAGHTLLPNGLLDIYNRLFREQISLSKALLIFVSPFHLCQFSTRSISFSRISSKFWIYLKNIILEISITLTNMFKKTHKKRNNLRYLFWRKLFKQLPPNRRLMRQGFKLMKCLQLPISCSAPSCRWRRRDCAADLWNSQHLQGLV